MRPPHLCSLYPVFIESLSANAANGTMLVLSTATGCLYQHDQKIYLLTNWHVLSGRHAITRAPLHTQSALPEEIRIHYPISGRLHEEIVDCYPLKSGTKNYCWLQHPLGNSVDIGALEITPPKGIATLPINGAVATPGLVSRDQFFFVTQEVWVIGFPKGIRTGGLPTWKRATIASEPGLSSTESKHRIILDTATRDGMSGSPVLFVNKSLASVQFDGANQPVDLPSAKLLLGIYSGRIAGNDELAAQLGVVWDYESITELFAANTFFQPEDAPNP